MIRLVRKSTEGKRNERGKEKSGEEKVDPGEARGS